MNDIEKQLRQKIGDTTASEQRIRQRVMTKRKQKHRRIWWVAPIVIAIMCIAFMTLHRPTPQTATIVETKTMNEEKTGATKTVTVDFYDRLMTYLNDGKETTLYFTPSQLFEGDYITTKCGAAFCELAMGLQQDTTDYVATFGEATLIDEQLSPDSKLILLLLQTEEGYRLAFIDRTFELDPPEVKKTYEQLASVQWKTPTRIVLTFQDGRKKLLHIQRYDLKE